MSVQVVAHDAERVVGGPARRPHDLAHVVTQVVSATMEDGSTGVCDDERCVSERAVRRGESDPSSASFFLLPPSAAIMMAHTQGTQAAAVRVM